MIEPPSPRRERGGLGFGAGFAKDFRGPSANWGIVDSIEVGGAFRYRHDDMFSVQAGVANKGLFMSSTVTLKF